VAQRRARRRRRVNRRGVWLLAAVGALAALAWAPQLTDRRPPPSRATVAPLPFQPLAAADLPRSARLEAPAMRQAPLLNGCEVTSLAMLLTYFGRPVSKYVLEALAPRATTPPVLAIRPGFHGNPLLEVVRWGNPEEGFVGSMRGADGALGYGMYNRPAVRLVDMLWPEAGLDLTGRPFASVEAFVAAGIPVVVWTTIDFQPTEDWVTWASPEGPVRATPMEHAVLLVGYGPGTLWVNNPATGAAAQPVPKAPFLAAWRQLGQQAVTISPRVLARAGWRFPYTLAGVVTGPSPR
jgi:uncharacterized protein YvpB